MNDFLKDALKQCLFTDLDDAILERVPQKEGTNNLRWVILNVRPTAGSFLAHQVRNEVGEPLEVPPEPTVSPHLRDRVRRYFADKARNAPESDHEY